MSHASDPDDRRQQLRRLGYSYYLRTGRVPLEIKSALGEDIAGGYWVKFNPYHDPENGRFTFAPGHPNAIGNAVTSDRRNAAETARRTVPPKPTSAPKTDATDLGALSASQESSRQQNPGLVSTGEGDSGGISYGSYQLSTKKGTATEFIGSPEAKTWTSEFRGLEAGTPAFSAKWKAIAKHDPAAFHAAQKAFIQRTIYDAAAKKVRSASSYDLNAGSNAIRQVTFSTAVQHGSSGGPAVINEAIRRTDLRLKRTDPRYEAALISNIYDRRTEIFLASSARDKALSEKYMKFGDLKRATTYTKRAKIEKNVATIRFPQERIEALRLIR